MNSAKERAVEAGARAICADYDELPELAGYSERKTHSNRYWADRQEVRADVALILSAAFPILAEGLVEMVDARVKHLVAERHLYADETSQTACLECALEAQGIAKSLRARIQQMAEADHE